MFIKCVKKALIFFIALSMIVACPQIDCFVFRIYALPTNVSVKGTIVNVRNGPGTDYNIIGTVALGFKIKPLEIVKDTSNNGKNWYRFLYNNNNGYIRTDFVKELSVYSYDATFEAAINMEGFPESYKNGLRDLHANYPNWIFKKQNVGLDFDYAVNNELIGTRTLVTSGAISSYKSTEEGKYDYTTSKWPTFDGGSWVCASKEVTMAYMDPRNFLYDPYIFQFEHQTFNSSIHTIDGIKEMVKGTFLDAIVNTEGLISETSVNNTDGIVNNGIGPGQFIPQNINQNSNVILPGNSITDFNNGPVIPVIGFTNSGPIVYEVSGPGAYIPSTNNTSATIYAADDNTPTSFPYKYLPKGTYTYADLIYDASKQVNVNPYVIVSMILQEQGDNGTDSVSGKNSKYKGYYNFGNINAFASNGLSTIENGLKYAQETGSYNRPWNSKEKGIYGLCDFYSNSYVKGGQDTFYLKKWNVQGPDMFKHQYMTNVAGAASEGQLLAKAYDEKMIQMPHEFKIPVYNNMAETNYPIPVKDGSPNNRLKSLSVDNYVITPTFDPNINDYSLIIYENVNSINIKAEAFDTRAAVGGIGTVFTETSYTDAIIYCVAENKDIRQYNIRIYKPGAERVAAGNTQNYIVPSMVITQKNNFINEIDKLGQVQVGVGPGL